MLLVSCQASEGYLGADHTTRLKRAVHSLEEGLHSMYDHQAG